jgi:DNA polymerase I-like protein with 3'-5' exonuclease and polymerase domains
MARTTGNRIHACPWPEPRAVERYEQLEGLMDLADNMQDIGWRIDRDRCREHVRNCKERAAKYEEIFLKETGLAPETLGKKRNGSTAAVRNWFIKTMEAPPVSVNRDGGTMCDATALMEWANKDRTAPYAKAAAALFGLRKNCKYGSYAHAYLMLSAADGRIHAGFFPFGTKTGRWTSGASVIIDGEKFGCNFQQVPQQEPMFDFVTGKPEKLVEHLRDCFIADEGCVLASSDGDAQELRLIAYIFGVSKMIHQIEAGLDTHWHNAQGIFGPDYPDILNVKFDSNNPAHKPLKKFRQAAKNCCYAFSYSFVSQEDIEAGKAYSTQTRKLQADGFKNITPQQTAIYAERFFGLYPEIKAAHMEIKELIDKKGYREIYISGRRLYYPRAKKGYDSGINATFQSAGAELMNRAMLTLKPYYTWVPRDFYLLGNIHDELVHNVPIDRQEGCKALIEAAMAQEHEFAPNIVKFVPANTKLGPYWPK